MAASTKNFSRLLIQSDWEEGLRVQDGSAWISFKKPDQRTVYCDIKTHHLSSDGMPYVTAGDNFLVETIKKKFLVLSYKNDTEDIKCSFQAPDVSFSSVHPNRKSISCIDVTSGGLAVSADVGGKMLVWETGSGEVRRELSGHLGDIYTCKFFPSGIVVLSGGGDMQLKIWAAESGKCAATLKGHVSGITDTAIVDRGKNIVSTSRDGSAKLWDCGTQTCLHTFKECGGVLNGCALGVPDGVSLGDIPMERSELEFLTDGQLLLVACENGTLQGYGLQSKDKVFEKEFTSAVNCCTYVNDTLIAAGSHDGELSIWDLRNLESPIENSNLARSSILSLKMTNHGLIVSTADGSCTCLNDQFTPTLEYTGSDCDPIYSVSCTGSHLYSACRDGIIRKYKFSS